MTGWYRTLTALARTALLQEPRNLSLQPAPIGGHARGTASDE
jgi:hypothetical protein